ncbi:gp475 [Bacillus phage G]|uniref:Gp475 n=1 Tax=Bacillus phage G TaxID=2884420 RepID=G3MAL6_9CAUD|nr:gp475 [Bacillus phage G]AEO93733.1 gp475 [Bacillus phage G]
MDRKEELISQIEEDLLILTLSMGIKVLKNDDSFNVLDHKNYRLFAIYIEEAKIGYRYKVLLNYEGKLGNINIRGSHNIVESYDEEVVYSKVKKMIDAIVENDGTVKRTYIDDGFEVKRSGES